MAVNKVECFGKVLLDLTGDTVTAETLAEGVTAHDASGAVITGTMTGGGGSGGGAQIATGRIQATSENYMDNPILVSGLGFRPKMVCFYHSATIQTRVTTPYITKAVLWHEGSDVTTYINVARSTNNIDTYVPTSERSGGVTVSDDGFSIKTTRADYTLSTSGYYQYIVAG